MPIKMPLDPVHTHSAAPSNRHTHEKSGFPSPKPLAILRKLKNGARAEWDCLRAASAVISQDGNNLKHGLAIAGTLALPFGQSSRKSCRSLPIDRGVHLSAAATARARRESMPSPPQNQGQPRRGRTVSENMCGPSQTGARAWHHTAPDFCRLFATTVQTRF